VNCKKIAAAAMVAMVAFAGMAHAGAVCAFDAGYYPRLGEHGTGTVLITRGGKLEICVPGRPLDCNPAKWKGDIIKGGGWTLKFTDEPGACKVIGRLH